MREEGTKEGKPLQQCPFEGCGKAFKKKAKLERHILSHGSGKSFCCPQCSASFKRQDHLKRHTLSHNPQEKSFWCPYPECSSSGFVDNYHLKRHIACVHIAPSRCLSCNITFEKKWLLAKHFHLVHGTTAPFECGECMKAFYTSAHYHEHMQRVCNKSHSEAGSLSGQKRLTPEAPISPKKVASPKEKVFYKCPYEECGSYLTTPGNLKVHILKHHERQALERCQIAGCSATYLHRKSLKEHMKKIHSVAYLSILSLEWQI